MQGNVTSCFCLNTNKSNVIQLKHFQYQYNLLLQSCSQEIWLLPEIFKKEAQRLSFAPFLVVLYRENCWQKIQLAVHAFHATKFCWKLAHNPGNLLQKKKLQPSKFGSHGNKETILNRWMICSKSCQFRGLWLMF